MLKPKQKAYLKGLANTLTPIFQIGKDGISEDMIKAILDYLSKHELMKISILNNSLVETSEAKEIMELNNIEVCGVIGHILILYKKSDKVKNPIKIPM